LRRRNEETRVKKKNERRVRKKKEKKKKKGTFYKMGSRGGIERVSCSKNERLREKMSY
jgi:hypothetical protein